MGVRTFERFVLGYIKKHGDVEDHDEALRQLDTLDQLDLKSNQVAGGGPQAQEPSSGEVAPASHAGEGEFSPRVEPEGETVIHGDPLLGITVHK